jgi:hypothetical protein
MSAFSKTTAPRHRLLRGAAMVAVVAPVMALAACAGQRPPPPAPVQAAPPPAPAPAPAPVPPARG